MFYFARSELRRAGDVSPLILRPADNQGIDIPRSPATDLSFDREQNRHFLVVTDRAFERKMLREPATAADVTESQTLSADIAAGLKPVRRFSLKLLLVAYVCSG